MASITVTVKGHLCTCSTWLVANGRGPVVVIEVLSEEIRRGRVGIFPPYGYDSSQPSAASPELLEKAVLNRFVADEFEITIAWLLDRYDVLVAESIDNEILEVKAKSTFYVHPKP